MDLKRLVSGLVVIILIPFIIVFDSLFYFITRPSCLNCGSIVEFLRSSSLTVMFLGSLGYQFKKTK